MGNAKECDRCHKLYKEPEDDGMRWSVSDDKLKKDMDMCPDCKFELEDFMEMKLTKQKKEKRQSNWSDESKQAQAERMQDTTRRAKEYQEKHPGTVFCFWK